MFSQLYTQTHSFFVKDFFFYVKGTGKQADDPPDGKWLSPPMGHLQHQRSCRCVASLKDSIHTRLETLHVVALRPAIS